MQPADDYELLDFGGGARLERFGERIVDRPHPAALGPRGDPAAWQGAELRFDRDRGWTGSAIDAGPWSCTLGDLAIELRPTDAGQVGLFPEHLAMRRWLAMAVKEHPKTDPDATPTPPSVLNLFAYTGLATLALAAAGAAVTHVDSSRPTVAWARQNAERSGLADRPIRWIVEDAAAFTLRELRRGRRYNGLVLDPPSYGHGPAGQAWRIDVDLAPLLRTAAELLQPGGFVLLTAHSPGFDGDRLAEHLAVALGRPPGTIQRGELSLATDDGRVLDLGAFARWPAGS